MKSFNIQIGIVTKVTIILSVTSGAHESFQSPNPKPGFVTAQVVQVGQVVPLHLQPGMYGAPSLATWHGDMNVSHCAYFSLSIHIARIPYGDWGRRTVEVLGEVLLWQNLTHGEVLLWEVLGEALLWEVLGEALLWEVLVEVLLWKVLGEILLQKYLAHGEVLAQSGNLPQSPLSPMSPPAQCWRRWTRHPQMNRATAQPTL